MHERCMPHVLLYYHGSTLQSLKYQVLSRKLTGSKALGIAYFRQLKATRHTRLQSIQCHETCIEIPINFRKGSHLEFLLASTQEKITNKKIAGGCIPVYVIDPKGHGGTVWASSHLFSLSGFAQICFAPSRLISVRACSCHSQIMSDVSVCPSQIYLLKRTTKQLPQLALRQSIQLRKEIVYSKRGLLILWSLQVLRFPVGKSLGQYNAVKDGE